MNNAELHRRITRLERLIDELTCVFGPKTDHPLTLQVQKTVAKDFGITVKELVGEARIDEIVWARFTAMALVLDLSDPKPAISLLAHRFGYKEHAGATHAIKRVQERRETEPLYNTRYQRLFQKLKSQLSATSATSC